MATLKSIESKIRKIALKSTAFIIGKTGQTSDNRLTGYNGFNRIAVIRSSKHKTIIDELEAKMIAKFINWKNNDNTNEGSAGEMSDDADKYILYVVYILKRVKKTS